MRIVLIFLIIVLSYSYYRQYNLDDELIDDGFTMNDVIEFEMYSSKYNKRYSNPF